MVFITESKLSNNRIESMRATTLCESYGHSFASESPSFFINFSFSFFSVLLEVFPSFSLLTLILRFHFVVRWMMYSDVADVHGTVAPCQFSSVSRSGWIGTSPHFAPKVSTTNPKSVSLSLTFAWLHIRVFRHIVSFECRL
jgi:hypothetical protein